MASGLRISSEYNGYVSPETILDHIKHAAPMDFVIFKIYPDIEWTITDAIKYRRMILDVLEPLLDNYIWHKDDFQLKVILPTNGEPLHVGGTLEFGDNIEDEWFVVFLLYELTTRFSTLSVSVCDMDGEFLLIEAASYIPDWLGPDNCGNRVWIRKGKLHIINTEHTSFMQSGGITVQEALDVLRSNKHTSAMADVQRIIRKRLRSFPAIITAHKHSAVCAIPKKVAEVLAANPQLISVAVDGLGGDRDSCYSRAIRNMTYFGVTDTVLVPVTFTRALYAQLTFQQRFHPPPRFHAAQRKLQQKGWDRATAKAFDIGCRLACGLEIAYQKSHNIAPDASIARDERSIQTRRELVNRKATFQSDVNLSDLVVISSSLTPGWVSAGGPFRLDAFRKPLMVHEQIDRIFNIGDDKNAQLSLVIQEASPVHSECDDWLHFTPEEFDRNIAERMKSFSKDSLTPDNHLVSDDEYMSSPACSPPFSPPRNIVRSTENVDTETDSRLLSHVGHGSGTGRQSELAQEAAGIHCNEAGGNDEQKQDQSQTRLPTSLVESRVDSFPDRGPVRSNSKIRGAMVSSSGKAPSAAVTTTSSAATKTLPSPYTHTNATMETQSQEYYDSADRSSELGNVPDSSEDASPTAGSTERHENTHAQNGKVADQLVQPSVTTSTSSSSVLPLSVDDTVKAAGRTEVEGSMVGREEQLLITSIPRESPQQVPTPGEALVILPAPESHGIDIARVESIMNHSDQRAPSPAPPPSLPGRGTTLPSQVSNDDMLHPFDSSLVATVALDLTVSRVDAFYQLSAARPTHSSTQTTTGSEYTLVPESTGPPVVGGTTLHSVEVIPIGIDQGGLSNGDTRSGTDTLHVMSPVESPPHVLAEELEVPVAQKTPVQIILKDSTEEVVTTPARSSSLPPAPTAATKSAALSTLFPPAPPILHEVNDCNRSATDPITFDLATVELLLANGAAVTNGIAGHAEILRDDDSVDMNIIDERDDDDADEHCRAAASSTEDTLRNIDSQLERDVTSELLSVDHASTDGDRVGFNRKNSYRHPGEPDEGRGDLMLGNDATVPGGVMDNAEILRDGDSGDINIIDERDDDADEHCRVLDEGSGDFQQDEEELDLITELSRLHLLESPSDEEHDAIREGKWYAEACRKLEVRSLG